MRVIIANCLYCVSLCATGETYNWIAEGVAPEAEAAVPAEALVQRVNSPDILSRADNLPIDNFEDATDPYLEGYIQALIDIHFYEYRVLVSVKNHHVYLSNLPKNQLIANSIISFVRDLPGVASVQTVEHFTKEEMASREKYIDQQPSVKGVWFPQSTVLFQPLVADPREPTYSVEARFDDPVIGRRVVAVSFGDDFPIFRWRDVWHWHGDLQIGIQGAAWPVFNFDDVPHNPANQGNCELVNTDFMGAIPLTYAFDKWSFRLRAYHISGHLGDEFIVDHPEYLYKRKNPSFEAIDLISSYQFASGVRGYFGPGVVFHSDKSFKLKPLYAMYGTELRFFGKKMYYHRLYGTPFLAIHLENWEQHHWALDFFGKLGYEISKLQGIGRKMRVYASGHTGYSYEGQFFNKRTHYFGFGLSWGF